MERIKIDSIIRSNRKTIALVVTQEARLIVRAPMHTSADYIDKLVDDKAIWIKRKLKKARAKRPSVTKEFVAGEAFLYMGRSYPLRFGNNPKKPVELSDCITVNASKRTARDVLIDWYKAEANKKITDRCEWFAKTTGYKSVSTKVTNAQKRWGSCSQNGNLNFSWRLIMAPIEIIDYVIAHELVHLEEKGHSKSFWNRLRTIMPDYKKRQNWLKENERYLSI
jgi:predicted metal-dependent hydrolase